MYLFLYLKTVLHLNPVTVSCTWLVGSRSMSLTFDMTSLHRSHSSIPPILAYNEHNNFSELPDLSYLSGHSEFQWSQCDTYHILHLWHSYKPVNHIIIETLKWNMISKYPNIVLCTNTDYLLVVCTCTLFNFFNSVLYWILVTNALLMFVPLQNPIMLQNTWGSWIKE